MEETGGKRMNESDMKILLLVVESLKNGVLEPVEERIKNGTVSYRTVLNAASVMNSLSIDLFVMAGRMDAHEDKDKLKSGLATVLEG
jgi:hypothetical protein